MALNKIRSNQIRETDHITEAELSTFDLHQNIFTTKISNTTVRVDATTDTPATLTIKGILCSNPANTSDLTISGSAGEKWVWAVRNADETIKTFTLEMTAANGEPSDIDRSRLISTLDWSGTAITKIKWNLSSRVQIEVQTPESNGQTVFTLDEIRYSPGREELLVFVNGQLQFEGVTYTETDTTTITFLSGSGIDTESNITFVKINSNNYLA